MPKFPPVVGAVGPGIKVATAGGNRTEYATVAAALAAAVAGDVIEIFGTRAESNLTLKAGVNLTGSDPHQCIISANDGVNAILNAGVDCTISNLTVQNQNAARPAISGAANTLNIRNCRIIGEGAGNCLEMTGGQINLYGTFTDASVLTSTTVCILYAYNCTFGIQGLTWTTNFVTAGALAHELIFFHCDFQYNMILCGHTGAGYLWLTNCTNLNDLMNTGTGGFYIDHCSIWNVQTTGTGDIYIFGGSIANCAGVVGSITWGIPDDNIWKVIPNFKIAHALAAAGAGDVIQVMPGTYAESNLTLKAGVNLVGTDPDQCIISVADAVNSIVSSAVTCTISNITIANLNAGAPAIRVTTNTLTSRNCIINGTGAGDAIQMTGGTLNAYETTVGVSFIDLSAGACTLNMYHCRINSNLDTAGALAHSIYLEHCDLNYNTISSLASGATTVEIYGCTNVHIIINSGTGTFTLHDSEVEQVNCTNAAGTIAVIGGYLQACGNATGTVWWRQDAKKYVVLDNMRVADAIAQGAIIVELGMVYCEESNFTLSGSKEIVGKSPWDSFIEKSDAANPIITITGNGTLKDIAVFNDNAGSPAIRMTAGTVYMFNCFIGGSGAGDAIQMQGGILYMHNCKVFAGDIDLSAGVCTLLMNDCQITTDLIDTSGAFAHVITLEHCDLGGQNLTSAATGATTLAMRHCSNVGTVSNLGTGAFTIHNSLLVGVTVNNALAIIRLRNCDYRVVTRTAGNIVDESTEAKGTALRALRRSWEALIASTNIATRTAVGGAVTSGGSGQVRLRINDNAADAAGVENNADAAGSLESSWTPARTPRYVQPISANAFRATTQVFFGLRETVGAAVPGAAEHHAGFIWDGTNFKASSSNGGGVGQTTNLATPSTDAHHLLEVIVFGGVNVEFYVDGTLVATHSNAAGLPANALDFQEYEISNGAGGATTSDVTLREGFLQECPA